MTSQEARDARDLDEFRSAVLEFGQTVEKPQWLSGKICPREVPREIRISHGQIFRQFLRLFHW